jgi:hypothetical protein
LPLVVFEDQVAGELRALSPEHGEVERPPGDDLVEGQRGFDAIDMLELQFLDLAARFEALEEDLDLPSAQIPVQFLFRLFQGLDREIGQQDLLDRRLSCGGMHASG